MRRTVSARLELAIGDPAEIALQIAAGRAASGSTSVLEVQLDGVPVAWREVQGATAAARTSPDRGGTGDSRSPTPRP